jgi:uncharacterized protein (DUF488 family)
MERLLRRVIAGEEKPVSHCHREIVALFLNSNTTPRKINAPSMSTSG